MAPRVFPEVLFRGRCERTWALGVPPTLRQRPKGEPQFRECRSCNTRVHVAPRGTSIASEFQQSESSRWAQTTSTSPFAHHARTEKGFGGSVDSSGCSCREILARGPVERAGREGHLKALHDLRCSRCTVLPASRRRAPSLFVQVHLPLTALGTSGRWVPT